MMVAYGLVQPLLDMVSLTARKIQPLVRDRGRVFACLCMALLAVQSLAPARVLGPSERASDVLGALFCFGATLSFAAAFQPVLRRRGSGAGRALARVGLIMLGYVAALESLHALASGQQPTLEHEMLRFFAIPAALAVVTPFLFRAQQGARAI